VLLTLGGDQQLGVNLGGGEANQPAEIITHFASTSSWATVETWYSHQLVSLGWPAITTGPQGLGLTRYGKRAQYSVWFMPMPNGHPYALPPGEIAYGVTYTVYACFWKYVPGFTNDGQPVC
jgi:hypothetical protein